MKNHSTETRFFKIDSKEIELNYTFSAFRATFKKLHFIECSINCGEKSSFGYGEDFFSNRARAKAFSESWERFWMRYGNELIPGMDLSLIRNSNGFAAHPDTQKSILNSKLELIERAEVLSSWQRPGIWKREKPFHIDLINSILNIQLAMGWTFEIYTISSFEEYETRIALLTHPDQGVFFDSACLKKSNATLLSRIKTDLKLLNSTIRTLPFFPHQMKSLDDMPLEASPDHHLNFYRNINHISAFDIHRKNSGSGKGVLKDLDLLKTNIIFQGQGLPTVCYSVHPNWPRLSWGKNSMKPNDIWPHPIA